MKTSIKKNVYCGLIIGLCFLWTACGYLSWLYHLMDYTSASKADWMTEIIGYLFQAAGYLLFALMIRRKKEIADHNLMFFGAMVIDGIWIVAAVLAPNLGMALILGYLMNIFHGIVAGFYLTKLAVHISWNHRGIVFGVAYGLSSIASWGLSRLDNQNFLMKKNALVVYIILILATILAECLSKTGSKEDESDQIKEREGMTYSMSIILMVGLAVLLLSLVKNVGFYFPMADISTGINLEFSRVFYAFGLIIAGYLCDKSRKFGAILCMASLVFPFMMLMLRSYTGISIALWIAGYVFFGFFTVFRVVIFADIAKQNSDYIYLAGFGMMFGRIGDAAGAGAGILSEHWYEAVLVGSLVLYFLTIVLFFILYEKIYMAVPSEKTPEEKVNAFAKQFALSSREIEVLNLVLLGKSNGEISSSLFISENTVKFHMRNLLKKTGVKNRVELLERYQMQE